MSAIVYPGGVRKLDFPVSQRVEYCKVRGPAGRFAATILTASREFSRIVHTGGGDPVLNEILFKEHPRATWADPTRRGKDTGAFCEVQ